MDWLLVLALKECLVKCTTLCVKSEVMLTSILCSTILPLALSCAIFCESKSGSFFTWLIQSGRGKFSKQPIWKGIESWHASKENPPAQAKNAPHSTRPVNLHPLFLFWKHGSVCDPEKIRSKIWTWFFKVPDHKKNQVDLIN